MGFEQFLEMRFHGHEFCFQSGESTERPGPSISADEGHTCNLLSRFLWSDIWDGDDLYIADNSNANTSNYSNLGVTDRNETGVNGTEVLAGQRNFTVKEIEVFSLGL
jgi:hypothetical protein